MSDIDVISKFGQTSRSLARNPLGIIALFIVLVYAFAALLLGASGRLEAADRMPLVWFLVLFPPIVLFVFAWLVSCHSEKLYAPKDFQSDAGFLSARSQARPQLAQLDKQIGEKVASVLEAEEVVGRVQNQNQARQTLRAAAERITREIRNSSFVTVDARDFTSDSLAIFEYPISAFATLSDLLNQVYNDLPRESVGPFEYGHTWVLKNGEKGPLIKSARMLRGIPPGHPLRDHRTLSSVNVNAGDTLVVTAPQ